MSDQKVTIHKSSTSFVMDREPPNSLTTVVNVTLDQATYQKLKALEYTVKTYNRMLEQLYNKALEKQELQKTYDFALIGDCDPMLFFHNPEILAEMLGKVGKTCLLLNKQDPINYSKNFSKLGRVTTAIILYRTGFIPPEIKDLKIPIGYLIDDNIFSGYPSTASNDPQTLIQRVVRSVDFCLAGNPQLVEELRLFNRNSSLLPSAVMWQEVFDKKGIRPPTQNKTNVTRVGIVSGASHRTTVTELVKSFYDVFKTTRNVKLIYFMDKPILESEMLEWHPYIGFSATDWYNALHNLQLDIVLVEFSNHFMIRSKGNLKWRESAFMKCPVVAIDPTDCVYKNYIQNGINGYTVKTRAEGFKIVKSLLRNKSQIKALGEAAHKSFMSVSPEQRGAEVLKVIEEAISASTNQNRFS